MSRFKVTYRKIVTTIHVEGQFDVEVEAPTPEQARACIEHGGSWPKTTLVGKAQKTVEVLGADRSDVEYEVRTLVERTST